MDVLGILLESGEELYPEDLEFFETELATGEGYDDEYKEECLDRIRLIRAWMNGDIDSIEEPLPKESEENMPKHQKNETSKGIVVSIGDVAPEESNSVAADMTPEKIVYNDIEMIRKDNVYKTKFKNYIKASKTIDETFVDEHYSFFESWELDAIISVKQMSEEFLEKYFDVLDHDKMARYQEFSEGFFMKHWSDLDSDIVLNQGKNDWRKKENRSKQLDVFLRLKGVKK